MNSFRDQDLIIHSTAPIRVCDLGGWTDTWFAEHGRVLNLGVTPLAEVKINGRIAANRPGTITIQAEDFGDTYSFDPRAHSAALGWQRHPLLEAAIQYMRLSENLDLHITVASKVPPGASTGTSAAVTVALVGGLDAFTPGWLSPYETAAAAQKIETEVLGQQCGVQDQLCSAFGGINYIEIDRYPHAVVKQVSIPEEIWQELEQRLVLVYLGKPHHSSVTHEAVIKAMERMGPENRYLCALRDTAPRGRDALLAGDFPALGRSMADNNQAQRELHAELVSGAADQVIQIARSHAALGWKVNGAGGDGGSLTILCGSRSDVKRVMIREIEAEDSRYKNIPVRLSRDGLRVRRTPS